MMKKITLLLAAVTILLSHSGLAQNANDCGIVYNLFKGEVQTKKYDKAYPRLKKLMADCPKLSVNIYKLGDKLAKDKIKSGGDKTEFAALAKKIYEQRLQYFPKDAAKMHSDYATFLAKEKVGSDDEIFALLEKAYSIDPNRMGVRNLYKYFQGVTDRNKDTSPQKVFDTYDDVIESVGEKLDDYAKKLIPLKAKEDKGEVLEGREKRLLRAYSVNSKALGQVESGLDKIIIDLSTCDRLIPLYNRDFPANKTNGKWLKRAVSRMYNKECTDDPLYETLVEAYVAADPSPEASVFFAGILYKKGKETEAMEYYKKAVDQQPDAFKKAENLYKIAQLFAKKGKRSQARNYANQAIQNKPTMGKAYLLIAGLYASKNSVASCGSSEFEQRMVYTAALRKARRAASVDPSIASRAARYIKNYLSQEPSKKLIFTKGIKPGTPFAIKCWINETVKVPQK
ncbi:MAG: tetratricopeptide repeat protein [Polaribacter sp.]|nr:tetratricopeptide repeat protein [Polaribacter sp.]